MDYLVVYDISDSKKRLKVSRILQKFGYRILYSAFYIENFTETKIEELFQILTAYIDPRADRLFIYPVDPPEVFKGYPLEPWKVFVFD